MEIQKDVARNIKNIRERKKITLESAAKLTGVSRSMLAQIEKGEAFACSLNNLCKVCR